MAVFLKLNTDGLTKEKPVWYQQDWWTIEEIGKDYIVIHKENDVTEDDYDDLADAVTDLPVTFATFMVLIVIALLFMSYYCYQESACMEAAQPHHLYHEYTLSKGCVLSTSPPQLEK